MLRVLWFFLGLGVLLASLLGGLAWSLGYFQAPGPAVGFTVQKGENFAALAPRLEREGIIASARALRWWVNFFAPRRPLQRGEFALSQGMPVPELVSALTEGKPIEHRFTVLEGENVFQIGENLEARGFVTRSEWMAAVKDPELIALIPWSSPLARPKNLEGYLFPDTYQLQKVFSAREIAQVMVQNYRETFRGIEKEWLESPLAREFRFNPHQLLILASIVEKETGAGAERPQIASVFLNRLRKRMRLQTDPTVVYGIYLRSGSWNGNIGRRDLDDPHEYNTYQHEGLPPGPISNPGLNAMKAVARPAETDFLYFVSRGDGTTIFSREYSAHSRAVRETQLGPRAGDGRSWRDLAPEKRAR